MRAPQTSCVVGLPSIALSVLLSSAAVGQAPPAGKEHPAPSLVVAVAPATQAEATRARFSARSARKSWMRRRRRTGRG